MDISAREQRWAFAVWLRTGRLPSPRTADGVQLKFNPWHDWQTGRFTFAGSGRYSGGWMGGGFHGGGGGRFGGGGASGTWDPPKARAKPTLPHPTIARPAKPLSGAVRPVRVRLRPATLRLPVAAPEPFRKVSKNGYIFKIDAEERTREVSGTIRLSSLQLRSRIAQARAGGSDRRQTDDGGHYIASRFNGPTDAFNHFAQDADFNRGEYRVLEDKWARARRSGKQVSVWITPFYDGASKRPAAISVWYSIDGEREHLNFPNERREKPRAER